MSGVVSTKVVVGVATEGAERAQAVIGDTASAAKAAQRAFADLQGEQASAYSALADLSNESQQQVTQLTESFTRLRKEMQSLPDALKTAVDGVLASLQRGDVGGAAALQPLLEAAPEPVRQQVSEAINNTLELSKVLPPAEVARLLPRPAGVHGADTSGSTRGVHSADTPAENTTPRPGDDPDRDTDRTTERDTETEKPAALLRSALDAIKEDDLERARSLQTRAARSAIAAEDTDAFGLASELPGALRAAQERNNGIQSERNFSRTMTRLEDRLRTLEGDTKDTPPDPNAGPGLGGHAALGRAARTLSSVDAHLEGGVRRVSEFDDLQSRLGRSAAYVAQAERSGAPDNQIAELKDQLEQLTEALEKSRESYEKARQGGEGDGTRQPDDGDGPGFGEVVARQLASMGGRGMLGGALGKLVPGAAVVGGAVAGFNLLDRFVSGANREARDEHGALTDLSRQLGQPENAWTMFRSEKTGFSDPRLLEMGYSGTDAARVASQADVPTTRAATQDMSYDILQLSRTTGLDETRLASAVNTLHHAGTYKPTSDTTPLDTVKMALIEAVRNGVSQADTLTALLSVSERALVQGRTLSPAEIAFQASLQATLAGVGTKALQGAAGAQVQGNLNDLVTGGGDPRMQMLLAPVVRDLTPEQVGLEPGSDAAKGLLALEESSPMSADFEKLRLLADGGSPEVMAALANRLETAVGGNADLLQHLLELSGITGEAKLSLLGRGIGDTYEAAAEDTPRFTQGQPLSDDVQADSEIDAASRRLNAERQDAPVAGSWGSLSATGQAEERNAAVKKQVGGAFNRLRTGAGTYDEQDKPLLEWGEGDVREWGLQQLSTPGGNWLNDRLRDWINPPEPETTPAPPPERPQRPAPRPPGEPQAAPPTPPAQPDPITLERGLETLGATKTTMQPGELYDESLRGSPAEHLIGVPHRGVDLRIGQQGRPDPIRSPWERAKVIDAGESETYDNWLTLEAANGSEWQMGHLQDPTADLKGKTFRRGDVIATEGNTGSSTNYHLDLRAHDAEDPALRQLNEDPVKFWDRFQGSLGEPTASRPQEMRVTVVHEGLDRIQVRGLEGRNSERFRAAAQSMTAILADELTTVSDPGESHHGFG